MFHLKDLDLNLNFNVNVNKDVDADADVAYCVSSPEANMTESVNNVVNMDVSVDNAADVSTSRSTSADTHEDPQAATFYQRPLPETLVGYNTKEGRELFKQAMAEVQ